MADYTLIYWPVPFRGQFIRAILGHAGKDLGRKRRRRQADRRPRPPNSLCPSWDRPC
ncbi:MAG: hypothetical protein WDN06_18665 [Asticcacaulis sp.]